jgi:hypothetical protein
MPPRGARMMRVARYAAPASRCAARFTLMPRYAAACVAADARLRAADARCKTRHARRQRAADPQMPRSACINELVLFIFARAGDERCVKSAAMSPAATLRRYMARCVFRDADARDGALRRERPRDTPHTRRFDIERQRAALCR